MTSLSDHKGSPPGDVIFLVEDDEPLREALRLIFEVEGFQVRAFADAETLLVDTEAPAGGCLVLDQKLPGMDGLDLVKDLRSRGIDLPTVLITTPTATVTRRAAACGVPLVEKPLLNQALLTTVLTLLGRNVEGG